MERSEKSIGLLLISRHFQRFAKSAVLGSAVLSVGFLLQPGESLAQNLRPEPLPTPIIPPRNVVDLRFFAGCELGAQSWEGRATHYFPGSGCVGCSEGNLTAMGIPLDYGTRTLAFMRLPLGSRVKITNMAKGLSTDALVSDRGGFEAYGYIADLAPATKAAIAATDITSVRIQELVRCR